MSEGDDPQRRVSQLLLSGDNIDRRLEALDQRAGVDAA
jgi:hypothetical protein